MVNDLQSSVISYRLSFRHIKNRLLDQDENKILWNFCNALGNKTRLKILKVLEEEDYCVCELEVILNKSQPTISHHLRILEEANLIKAWKRGRYAFYVFNKAQFEQEKNVK